MYNLARMFSTDAELDAYVEEITRNDGLTTRGCIPRLHTHFALRHSHDDSCYGDGRLPGDDGLCQDGVRLLFPGC